MNNYVVSINGKKKEVKIFEKTIIIDNIEYQYSLSQINESSFHLRVNNSSFEVSMDRFSVEDFLLLIEGNYFETTVRSKLEEIANETLKKKEKISHKDTIAAPMPGLVLKIRKKVGETVAIGEPLIVLEAMKMENDIKSPASGTIKEIKVREGDSVNKDQKMILIE